jgi:transmembrane sensor
MTGSPNFQALASRVAHETEGASVPTTDSIVVGMKRRQVRHARRRVAAASLGTLALFVVGGWLVAGHQAPVATGPTDPTVGPVDARSSPIPLNFRDGTRVTAHVGARVNLTEVREHGATIVLEQGSLGVDVVHTESSRWDVAAGPFGIRVTGTTFDAAWDPGAQRLRIAMKEGKVLVTGPCVNEALVAPATKDFLCEAPPSEPQTISSPTATVDRAGNVERPAKASPRVGASSGVDGASSLVDRADNARLAGDLARARALYKVIRERYPRTGASARATFLLARMAHADGDLDGAAALYEQSMAGSADDFSQEALGRLIELEAGRQGTVRARRFATEYLAKYPAGAHAEYARKVADSVR